MTDTPLRIAVINHLSARDLPATSSVSYYLHTEYGYDVTLFDGFGIFTSNEWAHRLRPDVIIFPKVIDPPRFLKENKRLPFVDKYDPFCVVLPTESGTLSENPTPLDGIDLFLSWNEADATWANEHHDIPKENIEVVGCPRYDLFAEENRLPTSEITKLRSSYGIPSDWDGPVVTVASSFPPADHYLYDQSGIERRQKQNKKFGWRDKQTVSRIAEKKHEARERFIELVQTINEKYPEVWITLKTHPDESTRRYVETLDNLSRFSLVTDDYSARYLQTSDLHIHHDCSTGIEAFMMDVPAINFLPYQFDQLEGSESGRGSFDVASIPEVLDKIEQLTTDGISIPDGIRADGNAYIESKYTAIDGRRAAVTAEVVDSHLSERSPTQHHKPNDLRTQLYSATAVDLFRHPDEQLFEYGKKTIRSLLSAVKYRPTRTGRSGGELPRLLSNQIDVDDIREVESLLNLRSPTG